MAPRTRPATERFWAKVDKSGDCWLWTGAILRHGYGYFGVDGRRSSPKSILAHRYAYLEAHGEIPEGLVLDHLCRNRACVNPDHLEPVTQAENLSRGVGPETIRRMRAAQTHCKRDHEFTLENTYRDKRGRRSCKECARTFDRERKRALRAKGAA